MSPSGMPVARSSVISSPVRTNGRLWPALASTIRPVVGSRIANRQVTNMLAGISGHNRSFARDRISPGDRSREASARSTEWVRAMTSAAGTPLSVTSPTAMPIRPSLISTKS